MVSYADVRVSIPIPEEPEARMNSAGDFAIDGWGENVDWSEEDVEEFMVEINPAGLDLLLRY